MSGKKYVSAKGAHVGLAVPGPDGSWQTEPKVKLIDVSKILDCFIIIEMMVLFISGLSILDCDG